MKIAFLIHDISAIAGMERVTSLLANKFSQHDKVIIISYYKSKEYITYNIDSKIEVYFLNNKEALNKNWIFNIINIKKIKKILKDENIDLVISSMLWETIHLILINNFYKIKIIAMEHFEYFNVGKINLFLKFIFYRFINKFLVLTEEDLQFYNNILSLKKVEKIENPLSFFPEEISLNREKKFISVGRLVEQKGFEKLIEHFAEEDFFNKYPEWRWEIYGEGPNKEKIETKIIELNLKKNILLRGTFKKIETKLLESSLFLLPSIYEPFGMVVTEAMACGTPVISFKTNGPKRIILDRQNGYLVNTYNEFIKAIEELIKEEEKRLDIAKLARLAVQKYSCDNIYMKWKPILQKL